VNNMSDDNSPSLSASVCATQDAAVELVTQAARAAQAAASAIRGQLDERPYVAIGVAAGVGFVIAGGLADPFLRGLARLALVTAARELAGGIVSEPGGPQKAQPQP
jgi:hypothetical protein